jgi:hypothetical protein
MLTAEFLRLKNVLLSGSGVRVDRKLWIGVGGNLGLNRTIF